MISSNSNSDELGSKFPAPDLVVSPENTTLFFPNLTKEQNFVFTIGVANLSQYEYELTFTYNFLTVTVKPHMVGK